MMLFRASADAPRWKRWLLYSALARILIFALLGVAVFFGVTVGLHFSGWTARAASPAERHLVFFARQLACTVVPYLILVLWIERRRPAEFALRTLPAGMLGGTCLGTLVISAVAGLLWVAGDFRVTALDLGISWWPAFLVAGIGTAVAEEIVFRGVLYRCSEEGLGTWPALGISGLFFGGAHFGNAGATVWSSLAIAIDAGLLIGLVFNVTRSLWPCIGLHLGWNFTEGTVWGMAVSGESAGPSFLKSEMAGPAWRTGGSFGPEASVITVGLNVALAVALLAVALRRRTVVPRPSRRAPMMDAANAVGASPC